MFVCPICDEFFLTECMHGFEEFDEFDEDEFGEEEGTYPDHPCACGAVQDVNGRLVQVADCCCE